ncbi:SGNH/GDSL hydrolase family protein [Paenibacillus contaminans]|nr:SGNH/GDSL hydrolase family protein [Paenibacillus contaminans]
MNELAKTFYEKLQANGPVSVVTLGDSWTYGSVADGWHEAKAAGMDRELIHGSWAMQLRRTVQERNRSSSVVNSGQGGWTAKQGLEAFDRLVAEFRPDLVVLNFGINDWRKNVPLDDYRSDMETIIDRAEALGAACLLWTSGPVSLAGEQDFGWGEPLDPQNYEHRFNAYNDTIKAIAADRGLPLADAERIIWEEWHAGTDLSGWFYDAFHFKQEGHDRIHDAIARKLGLLG